jgi:ABC-type transport system substrate-binding protein
MRYAVVGLAALSLVALLVLGSTGTLAQKELGEHWYRYGPYIDKITFPVMKDYTMRLLTFEAGELSMIFILPVHLDRVRTNRPDAHIILYAALGTTAGGLHFNVQNWPVKYLEVRQALAHLWNRDKIIAESPLRGIAVKCSTIFPPTWGAWVNWEADFEKLYPYNPAKARELLARVFVPCTGPDGRPAWCDPREGGRVVEIEILSLPEATSPVYWWIAMYIKEEAEKIGLRVTIKAVSSREMDAAIAAGTAQAWIIGWGFWRYMHLMAYLFHSREIRPGGWNEWRVNDSRVDALLDKYYYAKSMEEAMKYGWQLQEILVKEIIPWIPTYGTVSILAWDGKIDRDSIILAYAPPMKDPVGVSEFWWHTIRFKDRKFGGVFKYYHTVDITTYHPALWIWATEGEAIRRAFPWLMIPRPEDMFAEPRVPVVIRYWKVEETTYRGQKAYKFTITLFEGIRWQDGVEMTAEDYAYTYLKFGKELRTRWYYGPFILNLLDVVVVNKTTVELYLKDYGWADTYPLTETPILPKHIFEKLPNPLEDPSTLPHPTIPGLTAMVGYGPYVLARTREIAYSEFVWNPRFYWRHPDRTIKFAVVDIPTTVAEGTSFKVRVVLEDYLGARATNATVTVGITGPMSMSLVATHVGGGVYEVTVPGLRAGTYTVEVRAEQPIMRWSVDNKVVRTLTVGAAPAPAPVGPVIERPPTVKVEIPGIPLVEVVPPPTISLAAPKVEVVTPRVDIASTEAVKKAVEAVGGAAVPTASYAAVALGVVALGVAVAVRRR